MFMKMVNEAYPLHWPLGWQRSKAPKTSRFGEWNQKPSVAKSTHKILHELHLFGGKNIIISSNLKLKQDGLPYSRQKQPDDQGVAVYFNYGGDQKVIACDSFDKIGCNLWAIGKTIEALRGIDRWGCTEIVTKAFTGFKALPPPGSSAIQLEESTQENWWDVLGCNQNDIFPVIRRKYHELCKVYHPDKNGDDTHFKKIQWAYDQAFKNIL